MVSRARIERLLGEAAGRHPAGAAGHRRPATNPVRRAEPRRSTETFGIRPSSAGGFRAVEAALARKLIALSDAPDRLAVIVSLDGGPEVNLFTQTLVDREAGAWVEVSGNECIQPADLRLGDDQHLLLEALGFSAPTEQTPNHHIVMPGTSDWPRVAELLVQPHEAVFRLPPDVPLEVRIFPVGAPAKFRWVDDEEED